MQVQTRRRPAPMDPTANRPSGGTYRSGTSGRSGASGLYGGPATPDWPPAGSSRGDDGGRRRTTTTRRKRRKDPLWARLIVIFGALLMMTSGGVIVGSKVLISRYTSGIAQEDLLGGAKKKVAPGKALKGAINILMLGVDERVRNPGDIRSDTIIILHVPASHDQAYLVSMPRDTFVNVPAFAKNGYPGGRSKITDAFHAGYQNGGGRSGGAQLVAKIINQLTGVTFDGAAIIDFRGFKRVIDALGGVRMCVDTRVTSQHVRRVNGVPTGIADARRVGGGQPVVYEKGCRRMAGWEALDFSRQRYGLPNGDYDRQRHQQQLIKAMAKEATNKGMITDIGKLDKVIKAAGDAFILDTGGVAIADFVFTLKGLAANDLILVKTNAGTFNSARLPGTSAEALSPESLEMFGAVRDGTLAEWLLDNPKFISKDK
jgi:LCP family protein required for cell wall assembly